MPSRHRTLASALVALLLATPAFAQNAPPAERVIRMNGAVPGAAGQQATVRFAIYDAETGGTMLWQESQSVALDQAGQYTAFLGAMSSDGLPLNLFAGGAPRWLAVEGPGGAIGPRTLLAAVPYAVAAATATNATTLAGRPASDFQLTPAARKKDAAGGLDATTAGDLDSPAVNNGTAGFIGKFFNTQDLDNSNMFQLGSNIGVGTTTPLDTVHARFLNTAGSQTGLAVQNLGSTTASYSGMLFYDHTGALRQFQGYNNGTGEYRINNISPTGSINFMVGSTSRFKVSTNGFIGLGVGSNTPNAGLEMLDNDFPRLRIMGTRINGTVSAPVATSTGSNLLILAGGGHDGTNYTGERAVIRLYTDETFTPTAQGTHIRFETTTTGTTTTSERMRIDNNGRVGIGTINPSQELEVVGDVRASTGSFEALDTSSYGMKWVTTASALQAHIHRFSVDDRLYFTNNGGGNLTGLYIASGATSFTSTSDERLKRNIRPMTGLLDKIKGIRVASYDMASMSAGAKSAVADFEKMHHEVGSIAQDWLKDFPELVVKPDREGSFYGLNYDRIGVVALGAVKELNTVVEQKDAEIKALNDRIAALEAAIRSLTTAVQQQQQR